MSTNSFVPSPNSLLNQKNSSSSTTTTTTPATTWSAVVKSTTNTGGNNSNSTSNNANLTSNQFSENSSHQSSSSASYHTSLGLNSLEDVVGRTATPNLGFNTNTSMLSKTPSKQQQQQHQQHSSSCSSSSIDHQTSANEISNEDNPSLSSSLILQSLTATTSTLPARSQIKRTKMIYNCELRNF